MTAMMTRILSAPWFGVVARLVLTFVFWSAGIAGIVDFASFKAQMATVGLDPPGAFAVATIVVLLTGSALIVLDRLAWLGAGILAVFLLLSIPVAHAFWTMPEPRRTGEFRIVMEHISLIGGLILAAILSVRRLSSDARRGA